MAKPLMSRLLLKNTTNLAAVPSTAVLNASLASPIPPITPIATTEEENEVWVTPKKTSDLRRQLVDFTTKPRPLRTQRLLFQKVNKAFDQKDSDMAALRLENETLRAQLEATRVRKRRKVQPDPNSVFVNIEAIHRAQVAAGEIVECEADRAEAGDSSGTNGCVVVAGGPVESGG